MTKFATKKGPGRQFAKKGSGTAIRKLQTQVIALSNGDDKIMT